LAGRRRWLRNPGLKLLSLGIAIAVWFSLSGERRERTSERSYHIALSLVNIPPRTLIASSLPATVEVRLRGPFTAVRQLDPDKLEAVIDLSDASPGDRIHRLTPEDVNVPPDIEVISISPQEFRIALDEIQEKDLSVLPSITGQPAGGGRVVDARAEPPVVRALGPSRVLSHMSSVPTGPISVAGRAVTFSTSAALQPSTPGVRIRQGQFVTVTVRIEAAPTPTPAPTAAPPHSRKAS